MTLDELAKALERAAEAMEKAASALGGPGPQAPHLRTPGNVPLQWQGVPGPAPAPPPPPTPSFISNQQAKAIEEQNQTRAARAMDRFVQAFREPVKVLDELARSGGTLGGAATAASAALKTFGLLRGAYGWTQGVMERGSPNMAGQMQGTLDLVSNRIAMALSRPTQAANAGIQGVTDARPGATIGFGIGTVTLGMLGFAAGLPFGMPLAGMGVGMATGGPAGSAVGSWVAGEKALPSMRGLPQPAMHASGADWLESMQMRSLEVQAGTLEAENLSRQIALMSEQLGGLLTRIENNTRTTYR